MNYLGTAFSRRRVIGGTLFIIGCVVAVVLLAGASRNGHARIAHMPQHLQKVAGHDPNVKPHDRQGNAAVSTPRESDARGPARTPRKAHYVPRRLMVRFKAGVPHAQKVATLHAAGASLRREMPVSGLVSAIVKGDEPTTAVANRLSGDSAIKYAQREPIYTIANTPNDPLYQYEWGLNNTGQQYYHFQFPGSMLPGGQPDADIDAPEAWDADTGGAGVTVAVVDTGVDFNHPDLAPNIWTNTGETGTDSQGRDKKSNGVDDDGNGHVDDWHGWNSYADNNDPSPVFFHGTHVAGTIAAKGNNGVGVTGVSWNAKIMPIQSFYPTQDGQSASATDSDLLEGIQYAIANGAKVINGSYGCSGCADQAMQDMIDSAPNVLFSFAAGNSGADVDATPFYPCAYPSDNVICVAASTATDGYAWFSNYGATSVDLAAPGDLVLSTMPGGSYGYAGGTSMASPHVAGAAAVLESAHPDWTPEQVKQRLIDTTDQIVGAPGFFPAIRDHITSSDGRLNLANALSGTRPSSTATVSVDDGVLRYQADPGGQNRVTVDESDENLVVADSRNTLTAGDGCTTAGANEVYCAASGVTSAAIATGDLTDSVVNDTALDTVTDTGSGNDQVFGGGGTDTITLGDGNDIGVGGAGNDSIDGGAGDDKLDNLGDGGTGNDTLVCGPGDDYTAAGAGDDIEYGDSGNDVLNGSDGDDVLHGGDGSDLLAPGYGNDSLFGEAGNDNLSSATGHKVMRGGDGVDTATYAFFNASTPVNISLDGVANDGPADQNDDLGADIENAVGGRGDDTITGSDGPNSLDGLGGHNVLEGRGGDDIFTPWSEANPDTPGSDDIHGGDGIDTVAFSVYVNGVSGMGIELNVPAQMSLDDVANDGTSNGSATPASNYHSDIENLVGGLAGDTLIGSGGPDGLNGALGSDTLIGGGGSDTLTGGDAFFDDPSAPKSDTVSYADHSGDVTAKLGGGSGNGSSGENDTISADVEGLIGGSGNDTLAGGSTADSVSGGSGNDTITGGSGPDTLSGDAGDDTIASYDQAADTDTCGDGNDSAAGDGLDTINADCETRQIAATVGVTNGTVTFGGAPGNTDDVTVTLSGGTYVVTDPGSPLVALAGCTTVDLHEVDCDAAGVIALDVSTGDMNDTLTNATSTPATLRGGDGDDTMIGGTGADEFVGGNGTDTVTYADRTADVTANINSVANSGYAGEGDKIDYDVENLVGGSGNDTLSGRSGSYVPCSLTGNGGDDRLSGSWGDCTVSGGDGNDSINTFFGVDQVHGGDGNDFMYDQGGGDDTLYGDNGDDEIIDTVGNDHEYGGNGSDTFYDYAGSNSIDMGAGDDHVYAISTGSDDYIGGDGSDTVDYGYSAGPIDVTLDGVANDGAAGENDNVEADVENVVGTSENDTLTGGSYAASFSGGSGDDILTAGTEPTMLRGDYGNDTLISGPAAEWLIGGEGTDTADYSARTTPVNVSLDLQANDGAAGEGDTVNSDVEVLRGGSADDTLTGGNNADQLYGNGGDDTLSGGGGNDRLDGGTGSDTIRGDDGIDLASYQTRTAPVNVMLGGTVQNGEAGEDDYIVADVENVLGGAGDDTLTGSTGANNLFGGDGDDTLDGDRGSDAMSGGSGTDTVSYALRTNPVSASLDSNVNKNDGELGENDVIRTDVENITGGSGDDDLTGNSGANVIKGGVGDDALDGGLGADTLEGDAGTDSAIYASRTNDVSVYLDGYANDGESGEGDFVKTDVENAVGGAGNDLLEGDDDVNVMIGGPGNDVMSGAGGDDTFSGGDGEDFVVYFDHTGDVTANLGADGHGGSAGESDTIDSDVEDLQGGPANDTLIGDDNRNQLGGAYGNDTLIGNGGDDSLDGGGGDDVLNGGEGSDYDYGFDGDDAIVSRDTAADTVDCGNGNDIVNADDPPTDSLNNCETTLAGLDTSIDSGPANGSVIGIGAATFTFSSAWPGATFECQLNGNQWNPCTSPWNTGGLGGDNTHTAAIRAKDQFGDVDQTPATRSFTVDVTPPAVNVTAPSGTIAATMPEIHFSATDAIGVASTTCAIDNGTPSPCVDGSQWGTALAPGDHTLVVAATDFAGHVGSGSSNFTVDDTPPPVPVIQSVAGGVSNGSTLGTAHPTFYGAESETGAVVTVSNGGATLCTATTSAVGTWHCDATDAMADGTYNAVTATARDAIGNTSAASAPAPTFTIDTTPPPVPAIASPAENAFVGTHSPTLSGTESENGVAIRVYEGSTMICNALVSSGEWSCVPGALAEGAHSITVKALDAVGNLSAASSPRTFVVDTTAPVPSLSLTPAGPSTNEHPVTTSGETDAAPSSGIASRVCQVDQGDNGSVDSTIDPCPSGTTLTGLAVGDNRVTYAVTDAVGNVGSASVVYTVDGQIGLIAESGPSSPSSPTALSAAGRVDWAHWGRSAVGDFNHMASGGTQIGNFTKLPVGSGASVSRVTSSTSYTWSDGQTAGTGGVASASTTGGVSVSAASGNGYRIVVPASTTPRVLRLNVGLLSGWSFTTVRGRLSASLSDGSATVAPDTSVTNGSWFTPTDRVFTITYRAATAGQTLTVDWTSDKNASAGQLRLYAATLDYAADTTPPQVPTINTPSADGSVFVTSTPALSFSDTESGVGYQCRVDSGTYATCDSPATTGALANGSHVFRVRAIDPTGNVSDPASRQFTVQAP